ncbi:Fic family protein [Pseudomonas sp. MWU13-2517]|uniref:Fic family protein n=1 Tax=Pseudomonas sp. MWU13-2517 TaxID=2929055 RepID=UPI00200BEAF8|nr:Fic family protein [Pseudomonas sp. MWU13-2517]
MDFVVAKVKAHFRKSLIYPVGSVLTEETVKSVLNAQARLELYKNKPWPVLPGSVSVVLAREGKSRCFQHPLFEHYATNNALEPLSNRTPTEQQYVEVFSSALEKSLVNLRYSTICKMLEAAACALTGTIVTIRATRVGVRPDKRGCTVEFVQASDIPAALMALWKYMADLPSSRQDLLGASVAAVGLMNCHPFLDGNGRLARVLFNALMGRTSQNYIPLYDFYNCSPGAHVLRIRQAELFGEWDDWVRFHCDIIGFMAGH